MGNLNGLYDVPEKEIIKQLIKEYFIEDYICGDYNVYKERPKILKWLKEYDEHPEYIVNNDAARRGMKFPCNIHLVISKDTHAHAMSVLNDAKEGKIPNLGAIVCLRIKPVGRACKLDCTIPESYYDEILKFGIDNKIQLGFDSCGAKMVEKVLKKLGHEELVNCVESCESTRMSVYINKDCIMTPCSFCEHLYEKQAVNLKNQESQTFTEIWNNNMLIKEFRTKCIAYKSSCQVYKLDA